MEDRLNKLRSRLVKVLNSEHPSLGISCMVLLMMESCVNNEISKEDFIERIGMSWDKYKGDKE